MAKRASKAKPVKAAAEKAVEVNPIHARVAKMISRGDMGLAAAEVKATDLPENERDEILDAHPGLRDVCNRL